MVGCFLLSATGFSGCYAPRTGKLYNKKDKEGKKMEKARRADSCFATGLDIHMPVAWYAIESTHALRNIVKTDGVGYSCHPGGEHSFKSILGIRPMLPMSSCAGFLCSPSWNMLELCILYINIHNYINIIYT